MGFEVQGGNNEEPPFEWDSEGAAKFISSVMSLGLVFLLVILAYGSFFQVEPEEEAVVLRFGAPQPEVYGPGLHFKIPLVDRAYVVPVERQHRIEFGFRSDTGKVSNTQESGF